MKKLLNKKSIKKLFAYAIYVAVVYFIYRKLDGNIQQILQYDIYSFTGLILPIGIMTIYTCLNAVHWKRLMELVGEKVKWIEQMDVYITSFLLRYIPGNVVGILSRGLNNRKYGIPLVKSVWCWFLENIYYLVIGILLGVYVLIKKFDLFTGFIQLNGNSQIFTVSISVFLVLSALVVGLLIFFKSEILFRVFIYLSQFFLPKKYKGIKFIEARLSIVGKIEIVLRYLSSWALYTVSYFLVVYMLTGVSIEFPLELASINALAWSLGYLFILTPGGAGIREFVTIALLPSVTSFSVTDSVIIAITARVVSIFGDILAFLIIKFVQLLDGKRK